MIFSPVLWFTLQISSCRSAEPSITALSPPRAVRSNRWGGDACHCSCSQGERGQRELPVPEGLQCTGCSARPFVFILSLKTPNISPRCVLWRLFYVGANRDSEGIKALPMIRPAERGRSGVRAPKPLCLLLRFTGVIRLRLHHHLHSAPDHSVLRSVISSFVLTLTSNCQILAFLLSSYFIQEMSFLAPCWFGSYLEITAVIVYAVSLPSASILITHSIEESS